MSADKARREIEVKYFLGEKLKYGDKVEKILLNSGFARKGAHLETDFLPDTPNNDLKNNKVLLRVRSVVAKSQTTLLLTLKVRQPHSKYIDFEEIETELSDVDEDALESILTQLFKKTGVRLTPDIKKVNSLQNAIKLLSKQGLSKERIYLEKFRKVYVSDSVVATLDYFPDGMGLYLELEAYVPEALEKAVEHLGLSNHDPVTDDYGDLLKAHKATLPRSQQRKAKFSDGQRKELLN